MEKLQLALQKAREQRGDAAPLPQARRGPIAGGAAATDQFWADLTPFTPNPRTLLRNRIVTLEARRDAIPFDVLRTKTILHMRKNGWKRLAITSATSSCGKTVTACNIALSLARQSEIRTILVELDLRRPNIAKQLGATPAHDVSEVLSGDVTFEAQALRIGRNVAVCMARRTSSDPMQYLLSKATQDRLKEIEQRYRPDLMIFDLPPLMVGGDTPAFLTNVDCALVVARAEKSTISQIDSCEREIAEHTNVLGVVLNQYRFGDETAGYYEYET